MTSGPTERDPAPWRHVSGVRTTDPWAPGAPAGGYTYDPREGYADHADRYVSTRSRLPSGSTSAPDRREVTAQTPDRSGTR